VVLLHADWPHLVGAVALSTSAVIYALALRALGESWRIGLDRDTHGPLVTRGVFAVMRNPIYVSIDLHVLGTFACSGRLFFLVAAVFTIGALHVASRVEEAFLTDTYSGAYREYWGRVRRYCPWG
jgi:protein-S-isoprenylcysteine O-methyltransferase Ste14